MSFIVSVLLGLILGASLGTLILYLVHITQLFIIRLRDGKNINNFKEPTVILNPGEIPKETEKEVQDDERRRFEKIREYEKLRRIAGQQREVKLNGAILSRDARQREHQQLQNQVAELTDSEPARDEETSNDDGETVILK